MASQPKVLVSCFYEPLELVLMWSCNCQEVLGYGMPMPDHIWQGCPACHAGCDAIVGSLAEFAVGGKPLPYIVPEPTAEPTNPRVFAKPKVGLKEGIQICLRAKPALPKPKVAPKELIQICPGAKPAALLRPTVAPKKAPRAKFALPKPKAAPKEMLQIRPRAKPAFLAR